MLVNFDYIVRRMDNFEYSNKPELLAVYRSLQTKSKHFQMIVLHQGTASCFVKSKNNHFPYKIVNTTYHFEVISACSTFDCIVRSVVFLVFILKYEKLIQMKNSLESVYYIRRCRYKRGQFRHLSLPVPHGV